MQSTIRNFTVLAMLCLPGVLAAETPDSAADPVDADTANADVADAAHDAETDDARELTAVTSTRSPTTNFETERSQNVIDEDTIAERQVKSITDAGAGELGVTQQSTNRGAGTFVLRGMTGPENLILVDGVRFNQSTFRTGPNQYLDTVDPWALRQIEVLRGPAGVLYGNSAMGGVIQLLPHELPTETQLKSRFLFHSADKSAAANVDGGTKTGPLAAAAGVTLRRHGILRPGSNGSDSDPYMSGIERGRYIAQGYEDLHLRAATGFDIGDHRVRANYMGALVRDSMRVDTVGLGDVRVHDNDDHLAYVTGELHQLPGVDQVRVNVSWHRTHEVVARAQCSVQDGVVRDRLACAQLDRDTIVSRRLNTDTVDTIGASVLGNTDFLSDDLRLTWGGDAYFDTVDSSREDASAPQFEFAPRPRGNFASDSRYRTIGVFAHSAYELPVSDDNALRGHLGARVENFGAFAPDVTDAIGDISYSFSGVAGSAGVAWLMATTLNVYLNWNQGYRAPNLQETTVLGDSGNFYEVPNPDLGPERSNTFELGTRYNLENIGQVEAALWVSLLSNRITREATSWEGQDTIDGKEVRHRVNRDRAYFHGFDIAARTRSWKRTSAFASLSLIDGAVRADSPDPTFVEGPFHGLLGGSGSFENPRRLPPAATTVGVRVEPTDRLFFVFYITGAAAQRKLAPDDRLDLRICESSPGRFADDCQGSPGWTTFNARAGYAVDNLRIDLAALNLTDERYRQHGSGTPGAGFDVAAQLTLTY